MRLVKTTLVTLTFIGLSACAMTPTIGSRAAEVPPQLMISPMDHKSLSWDNTRAFGPVPNAQMARGASACASLNRDGVRHKALGYHPKARDVHGHVMPGGGFFCVQK